MRELRRRHAEARTEAWSIEQSCMAARAHWKSQLSKARAQPRTERSEIFGDCNGKMQR